LVLIGVGNYGTVEAAKKSNRCFLQFTAVPLNENINSGAETTYRYAVKNIGATMCNEVAVSLYYAENEKYINSNPLPTASDYYWSIGKLNRGQTFYFSVVIKNINGGEQMLGEG